MFLQQQTPFLEGRFNFMGERIHSLYPYKGEFVRSKVHSPFKKGNSHVV
jgi:hypothetical protein